jgi:flagellar M-ring protein FliF
MADQAIPPSGIFTRQRRLFVVLFAALCLALLAGYYLFLRTDYAVLYTDTKPADASAIVAELDAKGISHRLADNGTTILVPSNQTDNVRLAVAGSNIPLKGSVGFELFNKSDMGLTDFAQKINYQRALQGELARTIMMMDGIETARIHLAIPERSLFRGNRSTPKAAVEVLTKLGRPLTPDRVAGIQQLVASAVPDLPLADVVVLDGDGRIVSQAPVTQAIPTAEVEEQTAAQNYYSARAKAALAKLMPGLQFNVRTLVLAPGTGAGSAESPVPGEGGAPVDGARNFQLRITVLTLTTLNAEDQGIARSAIAAATGLNEQRGDSLLFELGPTTAPVAAPAIATAPAVQDDLVRNETSSAPAPAALVKGASWWMLALALLLAGLAVVWVVRARQPGISARDRDAFVSRVRRQLGMAEVDDARL